jgi:hypothetical protein
VHEKLQAQAVQAEEVADVSFSSLGLGDNIVRTLAELGAAAPFPIQAATIAPILAGKDVLARGRTGSGKTIAFGAPLVEAVLRSQAGKRRAFGRSPKALILAPTRELALQIDRTDPADRPQRRPLHDADLRRRAAGARSGAEEGRRHHHRHPGRIEDLQNQGKLDLSEVESSCSTRPIT